MECVCIIYLRVIYTVWDRRHTQNKAQLNFAWKLLEARCIGHIREVSPHYFGNHGLTGSLYNLYIPPYEWSQTQCSINITLRVVRLTIFRNLGPVTYPYHLSLADGLYFYYSEA